MHVWVYPDPGSGAPPIFVGVATLGADRPDVAAAFGGDQYRYSGFNLVVTGLAPRVYLFAISAHRSATGDWGAPQTVLVTVGAQPHMSVDVPTNGSNVLQPFNIGGWAIDRAAASGTGVDTLHIWAFPNPGSGADPIWVGAASPGVDRPDIGAAFGSAFAPSGFNFTVTTLPAGFYQLVIFAHSTVSGTFNNSQSVTVFIDTPVATPSISPGTGQYTTPVTVTLSTTTAGAEIYFRLDGGPPTPASFPYSGPFTIANPASLRAGAFKNGWLPSPVSAADYSLVAATPTFSPPGGTHVGAISVTLASESPGVAIFWTSNGSDPTTSSNPYTGPIGIGLGATTTLRARAFRSGWSSGEIAAATYTTVQGITQTPQSSPTAGPVDSGQSITISGDPQSFITYTTDGSEPTPFSQLYTAAFSFTSPTTVRARAFRQGYAPSDVAVWLFSVRVPSPTLSPDAGSYSTIPSVSIIPALSGDSIRYTLDRSEPNENSPLYNSTLFNLDPYTTVKAAEFRSGWAQSKTVTATYLPTEPPDPVSPTGTVTTSAPIGQFGPVNGSAVFSISGGAFEPMSARVYRNGSLLGSQTVTASQTQIVANGILANGRNNVELEATDADGNQIYETQTIWAGSRSVVVTLRTLANVAIVSATTTLVITDGDSTAVTATTNGSGQATFTNVPNVPARILFHADGYRDLSTNLALGQTSLTANLEADNSDFHQSTTGWSISGSDFGIEAHSEASQPLVPCPGCPIRSGAQANAAPGSAPPPSDSDLVIGTMNTVTPQTAVRQFTAAAGAAAVGVRYRMQTDELRPGGFANDTFDIRIDDVTTGQFVRDFKTVGTLQGQFDANAATPWYMLELPTVEGHTVRVTITVQNAVDNAYVSYVYADFVQEPVYEITRLQLNDMIDPSDQYPTARASKPIDYLSASQYASYDGYVRIHGSMRISGRVDDSIQSMRLAIFTGAGVLLGRDDLARTQTSNIRSQVLGVPFGGNGIAIALNPQNVEAAITPLVFEVSSQVLNAAAQVTEDEQIRAVVEITTTRGVFFQKELPRRLIKLVRYQGTNRTGTRDEQDCAGLSAIASRLGNRPPFPCGRDDWARPKVATWAAGAPTGTNWNDFSNLNGGFFPVHSGHRQGDTIDGVFPGYVNLDAAAAQKMLDFINARSPSQQIMRVLVGYSTQPCPLANPNCSGPSRRACRYLDNRQASLNANPFYAVIRNAVLVDGRSARDVIVNTVDHCDHFDVRVDVTRLQ